MFDRPITDPAVKIRNKFNKGLNDLAQQRNNHLIIAPESLKDTKHFERAGKLNYWGKIQFWREIDYYVQQYDRRKISLSLRNYTSNSTSDGYRWDNRNNDEGSRHKRRETYNKG